MCLHYRQTLNTDYIISGHIRHLGNRNLVIATIINVETFEQLGGVYREYGNIEEVRTMIPGIAKIITWIRTKYRNNNRKSIPPII